MKKFKVTKILAAVLAAMMLMLSVALVGCSDDSDDLAYIKKIGKLVIGITHGLQGIRLGRMDRL